MSQADNQELPLDRLGQYEEDLVQLAESDLPIASYADRALELLEEESD